MTQVKWGILGCGDIVRKRVAKAIQEDPRSDLIAVCRRNQSKLKEFCSTFGVSRAYSRAQDLISDPDIDAVYVATPVVLHRSQTIDAAQAGKHVLVEKPMALTAVECEQMETICKEAQIKLGVAYYRRFYPVVARMKKLIEQGRIGTPLSASAVTSSPFPFTPGDEGYWRARPELGGGGALMDIGSHRIDLFLDFFGPCTRVESLCDTLAADYETEDVASVLMQFDKGAHGLLQCFFGTSNEWDSFTVLGSDGRLSVDPLNKGLLIIEEGSDRRSESLPPAENLHAPLIEDFSSAVLDDKCPVVTGEAGQAVNDVIDRAYSVVESGS